MNQKQKQVNKKLLDEERQVIKELRKCYTESLNEVKRKIIVLFQNEDMLSKIYQRKYQQVLYDQLSETLKLLDSGKINSIEDFLNKTAETSFIGTLYEFNNDVPLLVPIDNKAIATVINKKVNDFNFSQRLHGDTQELTKITVREISRGFSTGMSYQDMARNISNFFTKDFNNAYRIAQTEGHRVSQETAFDTAKKFKEKGVDIVKQWDSTLDKKTRPHHVQLDGQIRELDEPFEVAGHTAMYPGAFGIPGEDIRCRCVMVKRARWALGTDETKFDGENNKIVKIKAKGYEEFKNKYQAAMKQQSDGNKGDKGIEFNDELSVFDVNHRKFKSTESGYFQSLPDIFRYSETKNTNLFNTYAEIDRSYLKTGYEYLSINHYDSGEISRLGVLTSNSRKKVGLTDKAIRYIETQEDDSLISIHNHPSKSTFSVGDVLTHYNTPQFKESIVINSDGAIFHLHVGTRNGTLKADDFRNYVYSVRKQLKEQNNLLSNSEINHIAWELIAKELGWDYEYER